MIIHAIIAYLDFLLERCPGGISADCIPTGQFLSL